MTTWCLEPIIITKYHFFSLEILSWPTFPGCLFVGPSFFSFVFNNWKAGCSVRLRSADRLCYRRTSQFLCLENLLDSFCIIYWVIILLHCEAALGWIWAAIIALYTSQFILLLLTAVTSPTNTSEPVPLAAIRARMTRLPPLWCSMFVSLSSPGHTHRKKRRFRIYPLT